SEAEIMGTAIISSLLGGSLLLFVVCFHLALPLMIVTLLMLVATVGLMNTTSFSLAMSRQCHIGGSASDFLGILPFAGGALVSPLSGVLGDHNMIPMGVVIFTCSLCAFLIFTFRVRKHLATY